MSLLKDILRKYSKKAKSEYNANRVRLRVKNIPGNYVLSLMYFKNVKKDIQRKIKVK